MTKILLKLPYILTFSAIIIAAIIMISLDREQQQIVEPPLDAPIEVHITEADLPINVYSDAVPLSDGWQCFTQDTCRRFGVPYELMLGLMETESSFNFEADSGWAYGITQIGYINADWLAAEGIDIYKPTGNIEAGCMILGGYLERYTTEQALMAYNQGEYGASEDWDAGIYSTKYSRSVMEAAEKWEEIINDRS